MTMEKNIVCDGINKRFSYFQLNNKYYSCNVNVMRVNFIHKFEGV